MIRAESDAAAASPPPPPAPLNVTHRLDAAARWSELTDAERAGIGIAAIDLVAAWACKDDAEDRHGIVFQHPLGRAGEAAEHRATAALLVAFGDAVPVELAYTPDEEQARLPASLGMVCRACGCSEDDACGLGCGWADDSLCTACATKAAPPSRPAEEE